MFVCLFSFLYTSQHPLGMGSHRACQTLSSHQTTPDHHFTKPQKVAKDHIRPYQTTPNLAKPPQTAQNHTRPPRKKSVPPFLLARIANLASRHKLGPGFLRSGFIFTPCWGFHATLLVALSCPAHTLWMVLLRVGVMFHICCTFWLGPSVPGSPGVGIHLIEMLGLVCELLCFVKNVVIDFCRVGWPGQAWQP